MTLRAGLLLPLALLTIPVHPALAQTGAAAPATPALGSKEKQVLERIRQLKVPRWRTYGLCRYDWSAWRLSGGGVRVTASECGDPAVTSSVGVHCDSLRITRKADDTWEPWRLPYASDESAKTGGEDLMVAALCANVAPTPAGGGGGTVQPGSPPPVPATPAKGKGKGP